MAYLSIDKTKEIRESLKSEMKGFKFSVRNDNSTSVDITLKAGPIELEPGTINHYYIERHYTGEAAKSLCKVRDIAMRGNFDKSDIMTDYFHVGWYLDLRVAEDYKVI